MQTRTAKGACEQMSNEKQTKHQPEAQLSGKAESLWTETSSSTTYPSLEQGRQVDVALVGGGLAGITAAYFLKRAGFSVAVIEAMRIGAGTSGNTTAKITALHGLKYVFLQSHFGKQGAKIYADSHQWAIEEIAQIIRQEQIACDFHRSAAYTYTQSDEQVEEIHKEVAAAQEAGLAASFVDAVSTLPFPIKGAVQCANQAYFHPRKFLLELAERIEGDGSFLFEQTRVITIQEGEPCEVVTEKGNIRAKDVIIATNFPIDDKGLFFARMAPIRSYALAATLRTEPPAGMFLGVGEQTRSLRPHKSSQGIWIVAGGENHPVGQEANTRERYQRLEAWVRRTFEVASIDYRWSAQDSSPVDRVPYIGKQPLSKHLSVTTGYGEWGMTSSIVSAHLLTNLLQGREDDWTTFYSPSRLKPLTGARNLFQVGLHSGEGLLQRLLKVKPTDVSALQKGEGQIMEFEGKKLGVSRDQMDRVHAVSAVCTHMGCQVRWNNAEQSWDCPCHGSRFLPDGHIINGPAVKPLGEEENIKLKR
jgi:glycine/D-amino acid oxidase-like deaminating enzyme/nitrite reductase/ring-hydroxylating ferredoxin subunit